MTNKIQVLNEKQTHQLIWFLRVLISALFLLSAFGKMYPSPEIGVIKFFEQKQLIDGLGFNEIFAQYFSRILIAVEIFIAISLFRLNYLKKIVLPLSILMLLVFSFHLLYSIIQGDDGNCGCFGELIPMTPFAALVKNVVSILILLFIYKKIKIVSNLDLRNLLIILLTCLLFMFIYVPLKGKTSTSEKVVYEESTSIYSKYIANIDDGEKLLCFFVPGCEHCQLVAQQITDLSSHIEDFPEVFIVFMDEEPEKIPSFFDLAGRTYNYQIMDIYTFMEVFWFDDNNTPGVVYLNNGNVLNFYQGSEEYGSTNFFDAEDFSEILENR